MKTSVPFPPVTKSMIPHTTTKVSREEMMDTAMTFFFVFFLSFLKLFTGAKGVEGTTVEELETYKHEKELTPPSQTGASVRLYRHMSRPDGQLTRNGEDIFVETITKDYGPDKIKSKITYAEYHCAKCIYNVL